MLGFAFSFFANRRSPERDVLLLDEAGLPLFDEAGTFLIGD